MSRHAAEGRLVRPYTMTGGRTGEDIPTIALEDLVVATAEGLTTRRQYRWEAEKIIELAGDGTAIIELAALLDVPVGVVRVVVADLSKRGAVRIIDAPGGVASDLDGIAYTNLLKKVLDGIRSL